MANANLNITQQSTQPGGKNRQIAVCEISTLQSHKIEMQQKCSVLQYYIHKTLYMSHIESAATIYIVNNK